FGVDRLEGRGLGRRADRHSGSLSAVIASRLWRRSSVGPLARFGLARGGGARPGTNCRRSGPVGWGRSVAGVARRAGGLGRGDRRDGGAAALAALPPARALCGRRSPVRLRRVVVTSGLYPNQIGRSQGGYAMPKYLISASYSAEGLRGLQ